MQINQTKDVSNYQPIQHQTMQVLKAFLHGHIVTIGNNDYRYAQKDQELFEKGDQVFVATESGIFMRMLEYTSGSEEPTGFRWMAALGDCTPTAIMKLIETMTDDERFIAISQLALDNVENNRDNPRSVAA